jgi:hypothetical protein
VYHQQPHHQANIATIADLVMHRLLEDQGQPPAVEPASVPASPPMATSTDEMANSLQRRETDLQSREAAMRTQMQDMMSSMMRNNGNTTGSGNPRQRQSQRHRSNGNRSLVIATAAATATIARSTQNWQSSNQNTAGPMVRALDSRPAAKSSGHLLHSPI